MGQVQMKTELIKWKSKMYLIQSEVLCYVMYIMSNVGVVSL